MDMPSAVDSASKVKATAIEAQSELERELEVRARIYDRWVKEGKLSWADARDRIARMTKALLLVRQAVELDHSEATTFQPQVVNG